MEQKPIKRSGYLLQLSKDHHFTLLFCWKIRQGLKLGVDAERMKKYVAHFREHDMEPHFSEEEQILFAPLNTGEVQKAISEHQNIRQLTSRVLQLNGTDALEQLEALANMVDAHIRYEERELFPYLEKNLSPDQLQAIGHELQKHPPLKDDYTDAFWIKEQ